MDVAPAFVRVPMELITKTDPLRSAGRCWSAAIGN